MHTGHSERKRKERQTEGGGWEDGVGGGQGWTLPAQLGRLGAGQDGKGLLQIHLWCPDDLPRLWDRMENGAPTTSQGYGIEWKIEQNIMI